jgi:hypothetical protein
MAAPLLVAGCGSNNNGGGTGGAMVMGGASGTGGVRRDAGSTGGARMDAGEPDVVSSPDVVTTPDVGTTPDAASPLDVAAPLDVASADVAVETAVAIDGAAVDGGAAVLPVVNLTGDACRISVAAHWTAAVYVLTDCRVTITAALTIDPGAVIKFDTTSSMSTSGGGTINATGTALLPIVFTSIKDDAAGGDTNADGTASTPASGDWSGIALDAKGSTFSYCGFYYAGAGDVAALDVGSVAATVTSSVFAHTSGTTDSVGAAPALNAGSAVAGTVITGNTFYDNVVPVAINTTFSFDNSNSFEHSASAPAQPQPNRYNGIVVSGCSSAVVASLSWTANKVPFVIGDPTYCNSLRINGGGHLTLGDNVILKFFAGGSIDVGGLLTANATTGNKIVFTSIKDYANGGDTNRNQGSASPAAGDWEGINVTADGSAFNGVQFLYTGADDISGLTVYEASTSVTGSVFAHHKPTTDSIAAAPALDASTANAGTVITGNVFYDDAVPLSINTTFSLDDSNSFDNSATAPLLPQANKYNGIIAAGGNSNTLTGGSISWSATKVAFVIGDPVYNQRIFINGSGHLTLGKNVTVKFFHGGNITVTDSGILTTDASDFFTSIKDDTHGGDTNADLAGTTPASGDWYGISIDSGNGAVCQAWTNMAYYTPPAADGTCPS